MKPPQTALPPLLPLEPRGALLLPEAALTAIATVGIITPKDASDVPRRAGHAAVGVVRFEELAPSFPTSEIALPCS